LSGFVSIILLISPITSRFPLYVIPINLSELENFSQIIVMVLDY